MDYKDMVAFYQFSAAVQQQIKALEEEVVRLRAELEALKGEKK